MPLQKTVLYIALTFALPAFAHDKPIFELDFSKAQVEISQDQVQTLIHQSHELIEGDESGTFLKRWREAFNFKARIVDGMRWSASVDDQRFRNLAIDSLFLFGLSHSLEMLSGPALLAIGYAQQWPEWMMATIAGGGTLISVPGLDPLCMVVFAFYAKSEKFRSGIGVLRLASLRGIGKLAAAIGLNAYVTKAFARPDLREYLESLEGLATVTGDEDGSLDFHYAADGVKLTVHVGERGAYLEKVTLEDTPSAETKSFLRQFGWNARDLVRSLFKNPDMEKPYLRRVGNHYRLSPHAVPVRAKRGCEDRLLS